MIRRAAGLAAIIIPLAGGFAAAQEPPEIAVRATVLHAKGILHGAGLHLRLPLPQQYFVTASLDQQFYTPDFAMAASQQPSGDPYTIRSIVAGAGVGRYYFIGESRWRWFWSMSLAAGFPRIENPATGNAAWRAGTEIHMRTDFGIESLLAGPWYLQGGLRIERHYVDLRYREVSSGKRTVLSSLTPGGVYLALGYRF